MQSLAKLSNQELMAQLESLVEVERNVGAQIVAHLCEVEARRLHLDLGYSSLYKYCVERLGLSEDVAYKRIKAARTARQHPEVLSHLASGDLSLSNLVLIAPHLDTCGRDLVEAACRKSKREVLRLVAELDPDPVDITKLEPVAGGRVRLEVVLSPEAAHALEEALALDRHLNPAGNVAELLERALGQYVANRQNARVRTGNGIPAPVKRQVAERDQHQCAWVGPDGHRCSETTFLEFDHIQPKALGGSGASADQVRLLCRNHNRRAAEKSYGVRYMKDAPSNHRPRAESTLATDVQRALITLGYSKKEAAQSVTEALQRHPAPTSLESFIRQALQCAPT